MSIAYCNELLRECTEGKLQGRGLWEEMKDDYVSYRAKPVSYVLVLFDALRFIWRGSLCG